MVFISGAVSSVLNGMSVVLAVKYFLKEIYYSRHLPWGRARAVASYTCECVWLKIIRQLKGEVERDDSSGDGDWWMNEIRVVGLSQVCSGKDCSQV